MSQGEQQPRPWGDSPASDDGRQDGAAQEQPPPPSGPPADLPPPSGDPVAPHPSADPVAPGAPDASGAPGAPGAPDAPEATQPGAVESGAVEPNQPGPTLEDLRPDNEAETIAPQRAAILRDPANRVSPRAIAYWTTTAVIVGIFVMGAASLTYFLALDDKWWWATALYILLAVWTAIEILIAPSYRYAVHRWEITGIAIYTRVGWLSRSQRIAPLSRVQTVDTNQGALMRLFGLSSVTVTTASAAGAISIDGLENGLAQRVVADLTEITSATQGDAT